MIQEYKFISNIIHDNRGECYLVGGYVRNKLLNLNSKDYDIATNLTPNIIKNIFKDYIISDYAYKYGNLILSINNIRFEITTYRIDNNSINRKTNIEFTNNIIIDSNRRDFTINAIYYDTYTYYDYHNGINDINNKIIRTIIDPYTSFKQDPLRMLRAIRFVGEYNFNIEPNTYNALLSNFNLLININKNSIYKELKKLIMSQYFIETFNKFQTLFSTIYPELNKPINAIILDDNYKVRIKQLLIYFNINDDSLLYRDFPYIKNF